MLAESSQEPWVSDLYDVKSFSLSVTQFSHLANGEKLLAV